VSGKGRDVDCFGGIVHWQGRWGIGTEYPEPGYYRLGDPIRYVPLEDSISETVKESLGPFEKAPLRLISKSTILGVPLLAGFR
jgi:hypothetical protein